VKQPVRLAVSEAACPAPLAAALHGAVASGDFVSMLGAVETCVRQLQGGEVDLALLPASEAWSILRAQGASYRVVPDVAVSIAAVPFAAQVQPPGEVDAFMHRTGLPFVAAVWIGSSHAIDAHGAARLRTIHDTAASADPGRGLRGTALSGAEHPGRVAPGPSFGYRLGSQQLSGLAAYFAQRDVAAGDDTPVRVRLFEFAYAQETPADVVWPRRRGASEPSLDSVLSDVAAGGRLNPEQALRLLEDAPLLALGQAADQRRRSLHPGNVVTYIIDRNVNYTNLCITACKFCNFYRPPKSKAGYTLSREILAEKFSETVALGGVQILLQGGVNPDLPLAYYEDLFRWTKANFPLALHALSPEEVSFIARAESLTIRQVLERLVAAGMDSLPGGGAEILDDEIRHMIAPLKCSTATWLEVMREAHALGLRTTATMVFGFGENHGHIVRHLERLRALQDRTSGFTAFICWPFQAEGTRLRLKDDTTAQRYLRVFSLARLYLDNFPNLQVSWPTMGPSIGQIALRFGGNDFGSAMIEENVVSQAGAVFKLSAADIERCVRAAGFVPRRRNMRYELLPASTLPGVTLNEAPVGGPEPPASRRETIASVVAA
jgi:cyclic dehypoxanthinyl futalosine synthase